MRGGISTPFDKRGSRECAGGFPFRTSRVNTFMPPQYSSPALKYLARELRMSMTDAEHCLWSRLRRRQIAGIQFYRQRPIGNYVVDFYAPTVRLVIEVDGAQHMGQARKLHDARRTAHLAELGLRVLRFDNRQVLLETDAVLDEISRAVQIPPSPPFLKGGN